MESDCKFGAKAAMLHPAKLFKRYSRMLQPISKSQILFFVILCLLGIDITALAQSQNDTAAIEKQIEMGKNQMDRHQWDSACITFKKISQASKLARYHTGEIETLSNIGNCIAKKGQADSSLQYYRAALIIHRKHKAPPITMMGLYAGIATRFVELGKYDSAHYYFHEGLNIAESYATKDYYVIAMFYNNLSAYWIDREQPVKALGYLDKGISILNQHYDSVRMNMLYTMLYANKAGLLYDQFHQRDSALHYFTLAANFSGGHNSLAGSAIQNIGMIYFAEKNYSKALSYFSKALGIRKEIEDYTGVLYSEEYLGKTYLEAGNYDKAQLHLQNALGGYKKERRNKNYLKVLHALSLVHAAQGMHAKAYEYLSEAFVVKDTVFSEQSIKNVNELEVKFHTAEKDKDIAQKQLEINRQQSTIKEKNLWIGAVSVSALFLTAFLFSAWRNNQNRKQKYEKQVKLLEQEQQIDWLKAVMSGEEQERARLARELHDGVGGMLAAIKMNASTLQTMTPTSKDNATLSELMKMIEGTASEIRMTAHNLMPDILINHDFTDALRIYCAAISSSSKLQIDLQFHTTWLTAEKNFELSLYRILQELIQNTVKHAQAQLMVIQFRQEGNVLHVTTEDDGIGFDTHKATYGLGLNNIKSRLKVLRGQASIESNIGRGTTCYMEFDITKYTIVPQI